MDLDQHSARPLLSKDERDTSFEGSDAVKPGDYTKQPLFSSKRLNTSSRLILWSWIGVVIFFVASLVALLFAFQLVQSSRRMCVEELFSPSPGFEAIQDHWEWRKFNGTVHSGGPYKGPPTGEVLERWMELALPSAFSIDHDMLMAIGGSPDSVRIPDHLGGGYMAIFEVHHQLHCLFELWKNTWPLMYSEEAGNESATFRHHLDHCADILRQQIMCNGDVSVIPQNWVKRAELPTPNFNGWRKCRSYEAIAAWETDHIILAPEGKFDKPADAIQLDEFP